MQRAPRTAPRHWFSSHTSTDIRRVLGGEEADGFIVERAACLEADESARPAAIRMARPDPSGSPMDLFYSHMAVMK